MIWEIIILVLAIPVGYLIAWLCRDELKDGQKWFRVLFVLGIVLAGMFWLYGSSYASVTCIFIAIVALVSLIKSDDKKWIRQKR